MCEKLFDNLNELSRPSYAEPGLLDQMISELDRYKRSCEFWNAITFRSSVKNRNRENINFLEDLVAKLGKIKKSAGNAVDFLTLKSVLSDA